MKLLLLVLLGALCVSAIEIDPRFSQNACIVIGNDDYNITCAIDDSYAPSEFPTQLPGTNQLIYDSIDDAIRFCPFSPALIEFSGIVRSLGNVTYSNNKDLIIRGLDVQPGVPAVVVGLSALHIVGEDVTIKMENFMAEGCETENSFFIGSQTHPGCIVERSVVIDNVAFNHYSGPRLLCQRSYFGHGYFEVTNSAFFYISGQAIGLFGSQPYSIHDNYFYWCGSETAACIMISTDPGQQTPEQQDLYNNNILHVN